MPWINIRTILVIVLWACDKDKIDPQSCYITLEWWEYAPGTELHTKLYTVRGTINITYIHINTIYRTLQQTEQKGGKRFRLGTDTYWVEILIQLGVYAILPLTNSTLTLPPTPPHQKKTFAKSIYSVTSILFIYYLSILPVSLILTWSTCLFIYTKNKTTVVN